MRLILLGNTNNLDGGKDHLLVQSRTQLIGEDIMSDIYIDLNTIKEFTEDHLETYKRLNPEEAYPWLFGDELPESLEVISSGELIDFDAVNWIDNGSGVVTQTARAGGKNLKEKEIARDIGNFGFKLTQPAIAVLQKPTNDMIPLNGRTRRLIFGKNYNHVKNFIGITYGVKPEYVNKDGSLTPQAESDISIFGCAANAYTDPAGELSKEDVVREVKTAIANKWITASLKDIENRISKLCGKGVFTDRTRSDLSYRIYNQYSPHDRILPWDKHNVKLWRTKNNLKDIVWEEPKKVKEFGNRTLDGIMYCVVSSSTLEKTIGTIARTAKENANMFIRVVIHTGVLEGFDPITNYNERVKGFREAWENHLTNYAFAFFNGKPALLDRIHLYGALPAIQSEHDLTKVVKFVTVTDENPLGMEQSTS